MSTRPTKGTSPRSPRTVSKEQTPVNCSSTEAIELADLADFYAHISALPIEAAERTLVCDSHRLNASISWLEAGR